MIEKGVARHKTQAWKVAKKQTRKVHRPGVTVRQKTSANLGLAWVVHWQVVPIGATVMQKKSANQVC